MSENNDGGLAERGGWGSVSGTGMGWGGNSGGSGGVGGVGSGGIGIGGYNYTSVRPYGELLPGARAPVVPGAGFAPRRDQTLADIQQQNAIGNANYNASHQYTGSNNAGSGQNTPASRTVTRRNPTTGVVETIRVPVPQPAPPHSNWTNYNNWAQGAQTGQFPGAGPDFDYSPNNIGNMNPGTLGSFNGGNWGAGRPDFGGPRAFGGPVEPGMSYTVGERGPETLQMGPGGGGQVIPHNPMDRLGSMSPQMQQQQFQLMMQQHLQQKMQQRQGGLPPVSQPQPAGGGDINRPIPQPGGGMAPPPGAQPPIGQPTPAGGGDWNRPMPQPGGGMGPPQVGGWQNRMGIEGLSRPMRPPGGGFGLSGLGQPGVMGQLRRQGGFGS